MTTLEELRENLGRTWQNITEGWRHLYEQASGALTRFTPIRRDDRELSDKLSVLSYNTARWGFMPAEVSDDDKYVIVKLEAPGMESEDFDIEVESDVLIVRGEKKIQREESKGEYHLLERAYGRFERAIPLPAEVDYSRASATYKRGILRVKLPRTGNKLRKRIEVNHL